MKNTFKKERPADGWPWERSPNRPFFVYSPEDDGFTYYATEKERDDAAAEIIKEYLYDGSWSEDVTGVLAGVLTHVVKKCDVVEKPDESELDDDGMDEEGNYWGDFDEICNFRLAPIGDK